ncbi:unnamed protein product, partial [Prorocentrum cordatum]
KPRVHNFDDKRAGTEVQVLKERMTASATGWYWVSSERQFADGFTKLSARQLLADRLRIGTISLKFDEKFQAAKKMTGKDRQEEAKRFATPRPKASTMTAMATMASLTTAASSEVEIYDAKATAVMELEWNMTPQVVIKIPLVTFIKAVLTTIMMIVGILMVCYRTHDKWSEKETRPHHSEPEPEQTTEKTKYKREQKVKTSSIKFH